MKSTKVLELIAAAIIHPKFKTAWIKNAEQKLIGLAFLENKIQQQQQLATNSDGSNSTDEAASASELEDDFFAFMSTDSTNATAENILSTYIGSNNLSFDELNGSLRLKNINTALPASAACERLYSTAGRVFMPNRTTMTDEHFEQQLLLRVNGRPTMENC